MALTEAGAEAEAAHASALAGVRVEARGPWSLGTYHSLLTTHYSVYSPLTTHYSLLTAHCSLLTTQFTHHSRLTTQ